MNYSDLPPTWQALALPPPPENIDLDAHRIKLAQQAEEFAVIATRRGHTFPGTQMSTLLKKRYRDGRRRAGLTPQLPEENVIDLTQAVQERVTRLECGCSSMFAHSWDCESNPFREEAREHAQVQP